MRLLERDDEAQLLRSLAAQAAGGSGACVVVAGPVGAGKTALLRALGGAHYAAGGELEDDVPFGVVRDLLGPLVRDPQLAAPEAAALAPAFHAEQLPPEPGAVLHGLFGLVADAATDQAPLTLVVDDIQWADPASVRFLAYLARRIADLPCLLVLGLRTGREARARPDVQALIAQGAELVSLDPLSAHAVSSLLGDALGSSVDEDFAAACHTATGGNPLLCVSTAQELARRGVRGGVAERDAIEPIGAAGVAAWVHRRIDGCGPAAADLAVAVAVLGPSATYGRTVALASDHPEGSPTRSAIDALVAERIVDDARPLAFTHPILRTSVLEALSDGSRARWHARAAQLLAAEGLDEQAAHHLRLAEPLGDPAAIELLRAAGRAALGRGAADVAVTYLRRALAEPPPGDLRAVVLLELGMAELPAGESTALEHLEEGRAVATEPALQAQIAATLADALIWAGRWEDAVTVLEEGIAAMDAGPVLTPMHWQLMRAAAGSARMRRATHERLAPIRGLTTFEPPGEQVAMGFMAAELAMTSGPVDRASELAHRALGPDGLPLAPIPGFAEVIALALALADEPEAANRTFDAAIAQTRAGGRPAAEAWIRVIRGWAALRAGRPAEAEADARTALGDGEQDALVAGANSVAVATLMSAVLEQRGPAAAREVADRYAAVPIDPDLTGDQPLALARARVALAEQRPGVAAAELQSPRRWEAEYGEPAIGWVPWRPLAVEVALLQGRPDEAAALADEHRAQAEAFGARSVRGIAMHVQARVTRDVALLEAAVALLRTVQAPTALAAALVDLGAMLRGRHEPAAARTPLREAMDIAERAGATGLADRARDELRAAGGRVRRVHERGLEGLTPAEARVCRLAARGLTNRQIAETAFVSPRTVEMHLSNAYRKLNITSRDELAGAADWADAT